MPNTPEHKVAMHELARQRRQLGQPVWADRIHLKEAWAKADEVPFEESRDAIVAVLRASAWLRRRTLAAPGLDELADLVDELADTDGFDEFNEVFDRIYDLADWDRVWIERF